METAEKTITLPLRVNRSYTYAPDCFVKIVDIRSGRYYYKVYIAIREGNIQSAKIIKVLNERAFEIGGILFMEGDSIKNDLVNGNEII